MNVVSARSLLTTAVALAVLAAMGPAQEKPAVPPRPAAPAPHDAGEQEADNPVIATVGSLELRSNDLLAELNRQIPLTYYHSKVPEDQILSLRQKSFRILVERSLVHQDAIARGLEASDDEIVTELRRALKSSDEYRHLKEDQLEKELQRLLPQFRPLVVRRLLIDRNEARFRDSVPKPDDAAVKAIYERMLRDSPATLLGPPQAHLQLIYLPVDPAGGEKAVELKQKKAEEAKQQLDAGKPFEEVAKAFSEDESAKNGGDLGMVKGGHFKSTEIEKVAFNLKAGEVSPVFRSLYGFHILRCLEVVPRRDYTIEEMRPMLEQWFRTEHTQKRRAVWMQELRERYKIEVLAEEFAEAMTEPAKAPGAVKKG